MFQAADIPHQPLDPDPKPCGRGKPPFRQSQEPAVLFRIEALYADPLPYPLGKMFPLATGEGLPVALGVDEIHVEEDPGAFGVLAVIELPHIDGEIDEPDGAFDLAGERLLEVLAVALPGLGIGNPGEGPLGDPKLPLQGREFLRARVLHPLQDVHEEPFPEVHDLLAGGTPHLEVKLDEFPEMSARFAPVRGLYPDVRREGKDPLTDRDSELLMEDHGAGEVPSSAIGLDHGPVGVVPQGIGQGRHDHGKKLHEPLPRQELPAGPDDLASHLQYRFLPFALLFAQKHRLPPWVRNQGLTPMKGTYASGIRSQVGSLGGITPRTGRYWRGPRGGRWWTPSADLPQTTRPSTSPPPLGSKRF